MREEAMQVYEHSVYTHFVFFINLFANFEFMVFSNACDLLHHCLNALYIVLQLWWALNDCWCPHRRTSGQTQRAQMAALRPSGGLLCFWPVSWSKEEWFNCVLLPAWTRITDALLVRAGVSELRGEAATCTPSTLFTSGAPANFVHSQQRIDNISRDKDTPDWQKLSSVYTHTGYVHLLRVPWNILSANEIENSFI